METVLNAKTTVTIEVKRGLPCAKHSSLGNGCAKGCRRCLTAVQSEKALRRLIAGYLRKPKLPTERREVSV